jgi:hypothetical protein
VELLKSQLQKAEALKRFLIARKNEWKTQLEKFGLAKNFKKLSKTVYYYQQQLAEYKNILNDPRKIERKALELLSKTKPWKDFFKKHSQLASLFRLPGVETENENMPGFAGLQTRVQVMSYASSYGSHENANQNLFSILKQKLQSVSGSIESMRDKINGMTNMPMIPGQNSWWCDQMIMTIAQKSGTMEKDPIKRTSFAKRERRIDRITTQV